MFGKKNKKEYKQHNAEDNGVHLNYIKWDMDFRNGRIFLVTNYDFFSGMCDERYKNIVKDMSLTLNYITIEDGREKVERIDELRGEEMGWDGPAYSSFNIPEEIKNSNSRYTLEAIIKYGDRKIATSRVIYNTQINKSTPLEKPF
ncbi:MAG: hypothetical protein J7K73_02025 [Nanoarchaeota archaeon]|nr:hypothetical protein [Nanoarchaeota archaeon]